MNETYNNVAITANIVQSVTDVMLQLNPENITVPQDAQELANDIQAAIARIMKGA